MGLETRERPRLVDLHQSTVADHVRGEDRSEPALWSKHIHLSGSFHETRERSKKALWARLTVKRRDSFMSAAA